MKQIYAFIDSQNLNLGIRSQGWKLDFKKFHIFLKDKFKVTKTFLFIGYIKENEELYSNLRKAGYTVVYKPTFKLPDKSSKGNVDAEIVLHAMVEYPNYEKAVLVTGDGDFFCLIDYLKTKKKLGRVVIPNKFKYSFFLAKFEKQITYLNGTKKKLEYKSEKKE